MKKAHKYIYIVKIDEDKNAIFNGINKEFILVNDDVLSSYIAILKSPEDYRESHGEIIKILERNGLLVDESVNEREIIKKQRDEFIHSYVYKTTILPTYECNYNCWYCLQSHTPVHIEKSKIDLIIKHIKKYLVGNEIKTYILSWFGGEPLTQPDIIGYVSKELLQFCKIKGIDYSCGITTNGALLSDAVIDMLTENEVNFYQIAIDGDEPTHNKNKHSEDAESSFALILNNITRLIRKNPHAHVTLRLNYTLATLRSERLVSDIARYLPEDVRSSISVDLQKVWQINEKLVSIDLLKKLQKELAEIGFYLDTRHVFSICYVEKEHYNMFYYNGAVEKCDKRPLDKTRGFLTCEGDVEWTEKPIFQDYDLLDSSCVCSNCDYLPLCHCGCPVLREERIEEFGKVKCGHNGQYDLFEHRIKDYCWRVINNSAMMQAVK